MRIWSITTKDLLVFFKDSGAVFYLFVLPLVFVFLFTGLLARQFTGSEEAEEETEKITLVVVNLDPDGQGAKDLIAKLNDAGVVKTVLYSQEKAERALNRLETGWYLTIPANFSSDVAAQKPVTLDMTVHPDANPEDFQATQNIIASASRDLSLETQILAGLRQMGEMQANSPQFREAFSPERLIRQAKEQFERSRTQPLILVKQTAASSSKGSQDMGASDWVNASVAGFTVMFVFLSAQGTARSIYDEKRDGSFRRLLAAPIRKPELLAGKLLPNFLLALLQVLVIFGAGMLLLPILGWGELTIPDPLSWAVVSMVIALCSTSLGILIASLAHTDAQISGYSTVILWIAGMLGGSFIPTFMMPEFLQSIARFVPHYWANQAFYDILARGKEIGDVIPGIAAMLVFTVIFFGIGLWRFDFD